MAFVGVEMMLIKCFYKLDRVAPVDKKNLPDASPPLYIIATSEPKTEAKTPDGILNVLPLIL